MFGGVGYAVTGETTKTGGRVKCADAGVATFDAARVAQTSADALELWDLHRSMPNVPLFSGGVLDAWPNWAIDALRIQRTEWAAVREYLTQEQSKQKRR